MTIISNKKAQIKDHLQYKAKTTEASFSKTPPGNLNIGRLVNKRPAWQKISATETLKNKTLVLADWSFPKWSIDKLVQLRPQLVTLMNNGFSIYIWLDGQLKQLSTPLVLSTLKQLQKEFVYTHPEEVRKEAIKKLKLNDDQIHILDDYWVNCIFNKNQLSPYRRLTWQEYEDISSKSQIQALLSKIKPPIHEIEIDGYSRQQLDEVAIFINEFAKEAKIIPSFSKEKSCLKLNKKDFDELLKNKKLEHPLLNIELNDLAHISYLELNYEGEISCEDLELLFNYLPSLTNVKINGVRLESDFVNNNQIIKLELSEISGDVVTKFLMITTELNDLSINEVDWHDESLHDIPECDLERLRIKNTDIKLKQLTSILKKSPNLIELHLKNCQELQGKIKQKIQLAKLQKLSIINSPIQNDILHKIKLKPKELILDESSVNVLPAINDSKLNILSIELDPPRDKLFEDIDYSFPIDLDKLTLTGANLSADDIDQLFLSTALLELNLNDCTLDGFIESVIPFERIKQLAISNLRGSDISSIPDVTLDSVAQFLVKTPRLIKLTLSKIDGKCDVLPELLNLETLILNHCNLDQSEFEKIIAAAPNLKTIKLNGCPKLTIPAERNIPLKVGNPIESNKNIPSVSAMSLNQTEVLDADTTPKKREYKSQRIFYPIYEDDPIPSVSHYRLRVFDTITPNPNPCNPYNAFTLSNTKDPKFVQRDVKFVDHDVATLREGLDKPNDGTYYYAKLPPIYLTSEWQSLPSLYANEEMTHMHVKGNEDLQVEVAYSLRDNLYYIRSLTKESEAHLDFLVYTPTQKPIANPKLQEKMNEYKKFGSKKLKIDKPNPNGRDYLEAIKAQKTGACRHRAGAFKDDMAQNFTDYKTRYVGNIPHALAEVLNDDEYQLMNLGGYPGRNYTEEQKDLPRVLAKHPKVASTVRQQEEVTQISTQEESETIPTTLNEQEMQFAKSLATWEKQSIAVTDPKMYLQRLVNGEIKKYLIEQNSSQEVIALQLAIEAHCQSISRPVFYVNSPDDLICASPYIKRDGNKGVMQKGPGGALYDFLQAHQDKANPPIIIVNYDHFDADEILKFNSIVDDDRNADGTPIPKSAVVIGLLNVNQPNVYQERDFYSRFDQVEQCPLKLDEMHSQKMTIPFAEKNPKEKVAKIDLFHGSDWKEQLFGQWELNGNDLYFKEGKFVKALAKGLPIQMANANWEDEEFNHFWQRAILAGKIEHEGITIALPESLHIIPKEGYNWNKLEKHIVFRENYEFADVPVLNPLELSQFFNRYRCDNDTKSLDTTLPGIIAANAGGHLHVNLTRELHEDDWARLLTECRKFKVQLTCHYASDFTFPGRGKITTKREEIKFSNFLNNPHPPKTAVIHSNDVDVTVSHIWGMFEGKCEIIDVSELDASDLLKYLDGEMNEETLHFEFKESTRYLINALAAKKNVILKGHFSSELSDALAPLILKRLSENEPEGGLFLVPNNPISFNYIPQHQDIVSAEDKKELLIQMFSEEELQKLPDDMYKTESLFRLQARLNFLADHPNENSDDAWKGMYDLINEVDFTDSNLDDSASISEAFDQLRFNNINEILDYSPYVFLAGLTGSGKTTFVEDIFIPQSGTLYRGEAKILNWAKDDDPDNFKFLFIDEANIGNRDWSEFEGLYTIPPRILINGELFTLTDKHKVIFAGNPLSYGGERKLPAFFEKHGNAVIFPLLPPEYVYEKILKPVLYKTPLEENCKEIAIEILKAYRFFCECATDEVLMSTREQQMIALLILSHRLRNQETPIELVTKHYIYQVCAPLVPKVQRELFDSQFKPDMKLYVTPSAAANDTAFVETESRQEINQQLDDLLTLSEWQRNNTEGTDAQKYGGLGGIFLEGKAAVGKSKTVTAKLIARGYKEVTLQDTVIPEKAFYRMPASMRYEEKVKLLLKAFHEGAKVVADEINSAPMMERLLNDLLMGKDPEGKRAKIPGFKLIATKNSDKLSGRKPSSTAVKRRMLKRKFREYKRKEKETILCNEGVRPETAKQMVNAYLYQLGQAKKNHFKPPPTFRDLIRIAKRRIDAMRKEARDKLEFKENEGNTQLKKVSSLPDLSIFAKNEERIDIDNTRKWLPNLDS